MFSCECPEGKCLHPGTYGCESCSSGVDFHPVLQQQPGAVQVTEQQQQQKQKTFEGESFDVDGDGFSLNIEGDATSLNKS